MIAQTKSALRYVIAALVVLLGAAFTLPTVANAAAPVLTGELTRNGGKIAGKDRSFLLYVPKNFKPGAPLLLVFHGASQSAADARITTGYEFDMLADENGFAVAYPEGINHVWSACRRGQLRGRGQGDVDDMAFVQAIIAHQAAVHGIDKKRVFATGYSNGGAISSRLALEYPEDFAGIVVISSSLPTLSGMSCKPKNKAIPMMIINGTADPINPYRGGVNSGLAAGSDQFSGSLGGMGGMGGGGMSDRMEPSRGASISLLTSGRGPVMSTEAMAQYWAKLNGQSGPPERTKLPHLNGTDSTSVDVMSWTEADKPPVILYSIVNGGHLVPTPYFHFPSIVGRQTEDMDAPVVIWDFFSKLPSRP